jgi:hypothetical protein
MTTARRQNLLEKEIPPLYSAEEKSNQSITNYQKCANPVYRALYSQVIKLKQTFFTYQDTIRDLAAALRISAKKAA